MNFIKKNIELEENGFSVVKDFYSDPEIAQIIECIQGTEQKGESVLKTANLFAIRQLIKHIPELTDLIFTSKMKAFISNFSESTYFLTKAIYFDKPSESNWFVAYHQDLSISVDQKIEHEDYINWTFKKNQHGVQPPIHILKDTITIRIHLDDTDENNGALKMIPKSHKKGIIRPGTNDWNLDNECICKVDSGDIMLMKPLTLHASNRTSNGKQRRVIHLEFNQHQLANSINWLERFKV